MLVDIQEAMDLMEHQVIKLHLVCRTEDLEIWKKIFELEKEVYKLRDMLLAHERPKSRTETTAYNETSE